MEHPIDAHVAATALVLAVHGFCFWYARRHAGRKPDREPADRTRLIWFLSLHCLIVTAAVNLRLLAESTPSLMLAAVAVMVLVVPLVVWFARASKWRFRRGDSMAWWEKAQEKSLWLSVMGWPLFVGMYLLIGVLAGVRVPVQVSFAIASPLGLVGFCSWVAGFLLSLGNLARDRRVAASAAGLLLSGIPLAFIAWGLWVTARYGGV